jgi:myo-inositol-hexaphosphate 3-phosphohydrolase
MILKIADEEVCIWKLPGNRGVGNEDHLFETTNSKS